MDLRGLRLLSKNANPAGVNNPQLLLAPFKGLTTKVFRNAFTRHFGDFTWYAPFISGLGQESIHTDKLRDILPKSANLSETIPQILSTDAREIILLGKTLHRHGYDHLNWNLGCPFSRIASKKKGSGLLPYPEDLDRILETVFKELPVRLSIKTRLGYRSPGEILKVMEVLNRYPIHLLIIHARIGTQIYSGEPDLEGFSQCLEVSKLPLAYNGDIIHCSRFLEFRQTFPSINTWMIGRGALINPFLPLEITGLNLEDAEKRQRLIDFHRELLQEGLQSGSPEARLLGSVKAVWYYMAGMFSNPGKLFSAIKITGTLSQYQQVLGNALKEPFASETELEQYFRKGIKHLGDPGA